MDGGAQASSGGALSCPSHARVEADAAALSGRVRRADPRVPGGGGSPAPCSRSAPSPALRRPASSRPSPSHGGGLWCVEPGPTRELQDLDAGEEAFHLVDGLSPWALEGLPRCDAYVIDGDHNYWTVTRELEHVAGGDAFPLTLLHDVAWPCARRDQYYAPDALPPEGVHPHTWELGSVPGVAEAVAGGFRGRRELRRRRTRGRASATGCAPPWRTSPRNTGACASRSYPPSSGWASCTRRMRHTPRSWPRCSPPTTPTRCWNGSRATGSSCTWRSCGPARTSPSWVCARAGCSRSTTPRSHDPRRTPPRSVPRSPACASDAEEGRVLGVAETAMAVTSGNAAIRSAVGRDLSGTFWSSRCYQAVGPSRAAPTR